MKLQKDITFVPDFIKMEPGTKYGTAAGKLYGINLWTLLIKNLL
jgi:hypothetical protein